MINTYSKSMKNGFVFAISALLVFWLAWVTYAAISAITATSGETLTATKWNDMSKHLVPSWAIMSFNLQTCPTGWKASDWTNSTMDLRWQFLRGLNSFNNWTTVRSDWKQDPERVSTSLGSRQSDSIQIHRHTVKQISSINVIWGSMTIYWPSWWFADYTDYAWISESRPRNMWVIFCEKE